MLLDISVSTESPLSKLQLCFYNSSVAEAFLMRKTRRQAIYLLLPKIHHRSKCPGCSTGLSGMIKEMS